MRCALQGLQPDIVLNFIGYDVEDVRTDFELFHGIIQQYIFISSTTVYARPPRDCLSARNRPWATLSGNTRRRNSNVRSICSSDGRRVVPGNDRPSFSHLFKTVDSQPALEFELHFCRASRAGKTSLRPERWPNSMDADRGERHRGRSPGIGGNAEAPAKPSTSRATKYSLGIKLLPKSPPPWAWLRRKSFQYLLTSSATWHRR